MAVRHQMRLANLPAVRANSFDELRGALAAKGLRSNRAGDGGETARMNTAFRDGWYIAYMDYDMPLAIAAPADRDDYTLYLPLGGAVQASDGRDCIDCSATRSVMTSPHRPLLTQTSARARRVNLTVKRDVMQRHLMSLLGDVPARAPTFTLGLDMTTPRMRAYLAYFWGIVEALEQDGGFLDHPMIGRAAEEALVVGLLQAQPHDFTAQLTAGPGPATADVKRALDYIEANLAADLTLGDLAAVARVPARTLQAHFQARFGCGPMRYLRDRRLCMARQDLAVDEPALTVTDVALRWGFGSPGRFAGIYRDRFGESPSQTLRRRG